MPALRVPLRLEAGKTERVRFAFTVSQETSDAAQSALRLINERARAGLHLDAVAENLSMTHEDIGAMRLCRTRCPAVVARATS